MGAVRVVQSPHMHAVCCIIHMPPCRVGVVGTGTRNTGSSSMPPSSIAATPTRVCLVLPHAGRCALAGRNIIQFRFLQYYSDADALVGGADSLLRLSGENAGNSYVLHCTCVDAMQTEEEKGVKVGFGRLLGMNRREWPYLAVGVLAAAAIGTVQPLFAIILSRVTALLTPDEPASNILKFCIYFFVLAGAQLICGGLQVTPAAHPCHALPAPPSFDMPRGDHCTAATRQPLGNAPVACCVLGSGL